MTYYIIKHGDLFFEQDFAGWSWQDARHLAYVYFNYDEAKKVAENLALLCNANITVEEYK